MKVVGRLYDHYRSIVSSYVFLKLTKMQNVCLFFLVTVVFVRSGKAVLGGLEDNRQGRAIYFGVCSAQWGSHCRA